MIPTVFKPYLLLAVAIAWAASLLWVGIWQNKAGRVAERVDWQEQQNEDLRLANERIKELVTAAQEKERAHTQRIADISVAHTKEINDAKVLRDRDVAAARSGAIRLRFSQSGGAVSDRSPVAPAGAAPGGCDGCPPGELPGPLAAALYELAHDADDTARQLAACQQVIIEDRRLCNAP